MQILKNKKYFVAILILVLAIVASQFYNSSLEGKLEFGPITHLSGESGEQGTTSGKKSPADFPVKDVSSEVEVPAKKRVSLNTDLSIKKDFSNDSAPSNTGALEATTNDGGSFSIDTDGSLRKSELSEKKLPGCKKPVRVTLPDGEKAFMLTVYADKKVSTRDLMKSPIFEGDEKNINSILYFDKKEFERYNSSLDSVLTNTGFVQVKNNGIDFTKFGLLEGKPEAIDAFHPLFLFSKTANFGKFCQQFSNDTYYEITDKSEHFDVLAMPKLDPDNNAQISNIYDDDIFKYLGVEVEVSAMPSSYAVYRVKFNKAKEDRCISSTGICAEPVVGEAVSGFFEEKAPVKEIDTKFIDVLSSYEGAKNELLATLQVGRDMTVSLSSNDKTVQEQLAFFQGNKQINPEKDGLYTLKEGNYDIRNLDEVRLSNLKDINDFSITVSESKEPFNLTENFRRNKMVLSYNDSVITQSALNGNFKISFQESTQDRSLTFDDIQNDFLFLTLDPNFDEFGFSLNNIDVNFTFTGSNTSKSLRAISEHFGDLNLNLDTLEINMFNFDTGEFGEEHTYDFKFLGNEFKIPVDNGGSEILIIL